MLLNYCFVLNFVCNKYCLVCVSLCFHFIFYYVFLHVIMCVYFYLFYFFICMNLKSLSPICTYTGPHPSTFSPLPCLPRPPFTLPPDSLLQKTKPAFHSLAHLHGLLHLHPSHSHTSLPFFSILHACLLTHTPSPSYIAPCFLYRPTCMNLTYVPLASPSPT